MIKRNSNDRRRLQRTKAQYFVRCRLFFPEKRKLDMLEFEAMTADLSEEGVCLITHKNIPIGQHVVVKFSVNNNVGNTLSSYRRIIAFTGTLVHAKQLDNNLYRLGISFGSADAINENKFMDVVSSPAFLGRGHLRAPQCENTSLNEN